MTLCLMGPISLPLVLEPQPAMLELQAWVPNLPPWLLLLLQVLVSSVAAGAELASHHGQLHKKPQESFFFFFFFNSSILFLHITTSHCLSLSYPSIYYTHSLASVHFLHMSNHHHPSIPFHVYYLHFCATSACFH